MPSVVEILESDVPESVLSKDGNSFIFGFLIVSVPTAITLLMGAKGLAAGYPQRRLVTKYLKVIKAKPFPVNTARRCLKQKKAKLYPLNIVEKSRTQRWEENYLPKPAGESQRQKKGKPSWNKGKKCSPETRRKMSEANRGEKNPSYGKTHSAPRRVVRCLNPTSAETALPDSPATNPNPRRKDKDHAVSCDGKPNHQLGASRCRD